MTPMRSRPAHEQARQTGHPASSRAVSSNESAEHSKVGRSLFSPLEARTRTLYSTLPPAAYDCVRLIVVRDGSAILFSEFGQQAVNVGDAILLCTNTLCGCEPEGHVTTTTIYLDTDYVVDQVFWQYSGILQDRLDAQGLVETMYVEPTQILHLGEERAGILMPWLDELVRLSIDANHLSRFYRLQALWFSLADVMAPFARVSPVRLSSSQRAQVRPTLPRHRRFCPLREEARTVSDLLRSRPETRWTLQTLATRVHMSTSQLVRVFTDAYGKTPLAYLTMIRTEELARLLRETDLPVEAAMRQVGWHSRGHAAQLFRQYVGVTPIEYRRLRGRVV